MSPRLPVYFINLADRTERRAFMEAQFERLGVDAKRVEAVMAGARFPDLLTPHFNARGAEYLGPPVAACAASHLLGWKAFLNEPGEPEWGLILEDDGILSAALPDFLTEFLSAAPELPVDAVQLEVRQRPVRVLPGGFFLPSGRRLARFRSTREGGACYLISRRAATILLARHDLFDQPIDLTLFRPFAGPGRAIRTLLTDPGLCIQLDQAGVATDGTRSDIEQGRVVALQRGGRLMRRAYLRGLNFFDHLAHLPRGLRRRMIAFDGDIAPRD